VPLWTPGQGGGGRDGDTNNLEMVEHKSLLSSSDRQQRLIFVGKTIWCHLSHAWFRKTLRPDPAQTVPISTHLSCAGFFLIGFPEGEE